jgi:hypothetical protein
MTIGPDIKEAIGEVGVAFTILRDSGDITGEFLQYKPNAQVTKPFIREFFLEAMACYDTVIVSGDTIEFNATGDRFLVMNSTPKMFENAAISFDTVLYKTNVVVDIYRPDDSGVRDNQYHKDTVWNLVKADVNVLMTSPLFGISLETDLEIGLIGLKLMELYIPDSVGLQVLDRLVISPDEYFRVEAIKSRRYAAVSVCDVGEDDRPIIGSSVTTTTTTTSSTSSSTTSCSTTSSSSTTTTTS